MTQQTLLSAGLVLLFVVIGGVFAATELALVSLRESQLSALEKRGPRGARVAAVARDPNRFLAAVQIGVTVAGFLSAAYGGSTLAPALAPHLQQLGLSPSVAQSTALVLLTLLIAYVSLVLGELAPKRLALQKAVTVSLALAPILDSFARLMRPVIWLLSLSTNAVVRLLGGDPEATSEQLSEEELRELVTTHEELEEHERRILHDVLTATDTSLKEVMRPRGDVTFLAAHMPLVAAAQKVRELPYSRYPVTGRGFDDIVGFLHLRDLLGVTQGDTRRVRDVIRPVLMLPSTNRVLPSVATMREGGSHLAIVVDEYGGTDGIVTLEDLVEELVGEITDEYDADDAHLTDPAHVDGGATLEEFGRATGIELPDGPYETIAGFVMARLGRLALIGDRVELDDSLGAFEVAAINGRRITALEFIPGQRDDDGGAGASDGTEG